MNIFDAFGLDRRGFTRCPVTLNGEIYFGKDITPVTIKDVSEDGIGLEISKDVFEKANIKTGETMHIRFADKPEGNKFGKVLAVQTRIARISEEEACYVVGGRILDSKELDEDEYARYVYRKKAEHIMTFMGSCKPAEGV